MNKTMYLSTEELESPTLSSSVHTFTHSVASLRNEVRTNREILAFSHTLICSSPIIGFGGVWGVCKLVGNNEYPR